MNTNCRMSSRLLPVARQPFQSTLHLKIDVLGRQSTRGQRQFPDRGGGHLYDGDVTVWQQVPEVICKSNVSLASVSNVDLNQSNYGTKADGYSSIKATTAQKQTDTHQSRQLWYKSRRILINQGNYKTKADG